MTWDLASNKVMDIWAPIRPSCGWNDCQECWIMNVHRKICNDLSREAKFKDIKTQWYKLLKVISCLPPKTSPTPAIQQRLSQICLLYFIIPYFCADVFNNFSEQRMLNWSCNPPPKGNGKTSSTSLSLSWRASHMAIQVAVGLDQWRASNTWRMGTFAAMLWAGFIWVGVPGIGLIMYGYFWNYHPPITILTRPIWYVWFLCLVMSGYNKIK